jgi:hypothetical protein
MPRAILIGFRYVLDVIPGVVIDLYHAYRFCQARGYNIVIITDMEKLYPPPHISKVIAAGNVDEEILHFDPPVTQVSNGADLLMAIRSVSRDDQCFIYYTGHGVVDYLVMPDHTHLGVKIFRDAILPSFNRIFWVMDCCNPNGLGLPYSLDQGRFRLRTGTDFVGPMILLITASHETEKAIITESGSLFTRFLFRLLPKMTALPALIEEISKNIKRVQDHAVRIHGIHTKHPQTVSVYSSYAMPPVMWSWVLSGSNIVVDYDYEHDSLVVH